MSRGRLTAARTLCAVALTLAGCAARTAPVPSPAGRLIVLMLNGGGSPERNYQSHLVQLTELAAILRGGGLPVGQMVVFNADGTDPAPDATVLSGTAPAESWRLRGTPLERAARPPLRLVDSVLPGPAAHPATPDALRAWFAGAAATLRPGDTLLLYVTDHGERGPGGPDTNSITLWGPGAALTVAEARGLLGALPAGVRVVVVMTQCFSGGFAGLMTPRVPGELPSGAVCGYFASTWDRPAYGCYPDPRDEDNIGYAFHWLTGLADTGSLADAHRRALVHDATPDVPLRTSDAYVLAELERAAAAANQSLPSLADDLLQEAFDAPGPWVTDRALLDEIARTYGYASPRSVAELDRHAGELASVGREMQQAATAWERLLHDANRTALRRFLAARPEWSALLEPAVAAGLGDDALHQRAAALVGDLVAHGNGAWAPDRLLAEREGAAAAIAYRMEVRLAVTLRLRTILMRIAGQRYLATRSSDAQRAAFDRLCACEDLRVPHGPLARPLVSGPSALPPVDADLAAARAVVPPWLGIRYRELAEEQPPPRSLPAGGAVRVLSVFPDSPAARALAPGDIILGPPGALFADAGDLRRWIMLSGIGTPRQLEILRAGRRQRVTVTLAPYAAD